MFHRISLALVLLPLTLASLRLAHAQRARLQGALLLSGGWTDNVAQTPQTPMPGMRGPEADSFAQIAPTLALSLAGDRSIHKLSYTFSRYQYINHSEADSNSHRGNWAGFFQPTSTSEMLLSASATYGHLNVFNL